MPHSRHTSSSAVHGIADMAGPQQKKVVIWLSAAIFLVLAGCAIVAGCLGAITFPGSNGEAHLAENEGKLLVYFFDVGQGDSTLFMYAGKTILIDAGEPDMGDRVVRDLLSCNVTRIDLLVATHPHSDHIGGMQKVIAAFPIGRVLDTGLPHPSSTYEYFLDTIEREYIPYQIAEQGQIIDVDPGLRVFVLSPPGERQGDDPNENSVVLRISYGTIDFLMTGDLDNTGEDALLRTGYPLDTEILKVGHHGSSFSTSQAFLARAHPETAIISVGEDNPYGHPHTETIDLLEHNGVTVYRTDLNGTILVRSDGMFYSVNTETNLSVTVSASQSSLLQTSPTGSPAPAPAFPLPALPIDLYTSLPSLTISPFEENWTIPSLPPVPQIGNASGIYISGTQFDAPGDDRQNLNGEWVRLKNHGEGWVLLAGWTISDSTGSNPYVFPAFVLMPGSSVTVYTGQGTMNATALFMGREAPLWGNTGDEAILKDGNGNIIDQWS